MKALSILLISLICLPAIAQTRIDNTIPFQTDPAKQYSIFIPSSYDPATPNALMLGLHPLNTNRWNSVSWCDTLINFCETNGLIMIAPDGGADGAIDDPIDTAFTSTILDSMEVWYNINPAEKYVMGFSWGGRTTYTYGLNRTDEFKGYLVWGAAVTGTSQVTNIIQNAIDEPFYIIHGDQDIPNTRFFPIRDALIANNACVETNLLSGVGHTIDLANRDQLLNDGFNWIKNQVCGTVSIESIDKIEVTIGPNPLNGNHINIEATAVPKGYRLYNLQGQLLEHKNLNAKTITLPNITSGRYFISLEFEEYSTTESFIKL